MELRRVIADGLRSVNEEHGGRFLSQIARSLGVYRGTVGRWVNASTTASYAHCEMLARAFPQHFDWEILSTLHATAARGDASADALTVGVRSANTAATTFDLACELLREPCGDPRNREFLHVMFHPDHDDLDPLASDRHSDGAAKVASDRFRAAMVERAAEGWRMRTVLAANSPVRLANVEAMLHVLDGPDVQVRAYAAALPLVMSPLVIARRDVVLAVDDVRLGRPRSSIALRSRSTVNWAREHFFELFDAAPYRLREARGVNGTEVGRLRRDIEASSLRPPA
jgi:hypothetical protein